ncbi:MAG: hypothetical protein ACRCT8_13850 [Lacipirellulaceae bacterium]
MASPVAPPAPPLAPRAAPRGKPSLVESAVFIDGRVRATRRAVWQTDVLTALVTLAAGGLGFVLVAGAVEHWVVPRGYDGAQRTGLLAVAAVAAVVYAARNLAPPLLRRVNPLYAARELERDAPNLKNTLVSALELRNDEATHAAVRTTVERQAAEGLAAAPEATIDRAALLRAATVLGALVLVVGVYTIASPKNLWTSALRLAMPWAPIAAPSRVAITQVEPGRATLTQGERLEVSADVAGLTGDETVELVYSTDDGRYTDHRVAMRGASDSAANTRYALALPDGASPGLGLQSSLRYRLEGGDARSIDYRVRVLASPTIAPVSVAYDFPSYSGYADRGVEGTGDLRALEGTRVTITAEANLDLASASIDLGADGRVDTRMKVAGRRATGDVVLRLDRRGEPAAVKYVLRMESTAGERNREPAEYRIETLADLAPEATIVEPQTPTTDVPVDRAVKIVGEARDPDFGLAGVRLRGETAGRAVFDVELLPKPNSGGGYRGKFLGEHTVLPAKLGLKPGDVVSYWVEATDVRSPDPKRGLSERLRLRVVDPVDPPRGGGEKGERGENDQAGEQAPGREQGSGDEQGANGEQGKNGQQRSGDQGGEAGAEGQPGAQGQPGAEGQPGAQGENGDPGPDGEQGEQGQPGEQGAGQQPQPGGPEGAGEQGADQQGAGQAGDDGQQGERKQNGEGASPTGEQPQSGDDQSEGGAQQPAGVQGPGKQRSGAEQSDQGGSKGESGDGSQQAQEGASKGGGTNPSQSPSENQGQGAGEPGGEPQPGAEGTRAKREPGSPRGGAAAPVAKDGSDDGAAFQRIREFLDGAGEGERSQRPPSGNEKKPERFGNDPGSGNEKLEDAGADAPKTGANGVGDRPRDATGPSPDRPADGSQRSEQQKDPKGRASDSQNSEQGADAPRGQPTKPDAGPREGTGDSGQNQAADQGGGQAGDQGAGESWGQAGEQQLAEGETGKSSGDTQGEGSKSRPVGSASGEQSDGEGAGERATQQQGEQSQGQAPSGSEQGDPSSGRSKPGGQTIGGGDPGAAAQGGDRSGDGPQQPGPQDAAGGAGDEANLDYARRQTDLVLDRLADQLDRKSADRALLEKLGWTDEDLRRFVDRWRARKQGAAEGDRASKAELDDALRSLGLGAERPLAAGPLERDTQRDLRERARTTVPPVLRERLEAYNRGVTSGAAGP